MRLIIDGEPVKEKQIIKDFRGKEWRFVCVTSQGKAFVRDVEATEPTPTGREFYCTVFRGKVSE